MYTPDKELTRFSLKWILWGIGILALLSIVGGVVSWSMGWLSVSGRITSVENIQEQWEWAYNTEEDLEAAARNYCAAVVAFETTEDEWYKQQRRSQMLAAQQNYNRVAGDYDAQMRNAFEAELVAPSDVLDRAPSLQEMIARIQHSEALKCGEG